MDGKAETEKYPEKKSLSRILMTDNIVLDPEKKKQKEMMNTLLLEKGKKREDNIIKDIKKSFDKKINR